MFAPTATRLRGVRATSYAVAAQLGPTCSCQIKNGVRLAGEQQFDLVLCNPPYLPQGMRQEHVAPHLMYEPAEALFAGARGMAAYQAIGERMAQCARPLLRAGGFMVLEVGMGVDQAECGGAGRAR